MSEMNNTDNQNMKDFDATGWIILPHQPIRYIDDETHRALLDESLDKYGEIWRILAHS